MSRAKKSIDEAKVADLAFRGASNREIGNLLGCDDKTVANRFSALLAQKRAERRVKLRDAQTREAENGNAAILIWLGKQELDQNDKLKTEHSGPDGAPITIRIVYPTDDADPDTDSPEAAPGTEADSPGSEAV